MRGGNRANKVLLAAGLMLAASMPLAWRLTRPPADAGPPPDAVVAQHSPETASAPKPQPTTSPELSPSAGFDSPPATRLSSRGTQPSPATRRARLGDLGQEESPDPVRLTIPAADVDAVIVPVGVRPDGDMHVPDDVADVGWYRHGPRPGEEGAAVLAGHVDSREQGRGAFFSLRELAVGAEILVTDEAGTRQRYEVMSRRTYDKPRLPSDELFVRSGAPRLVLVTCGGDFDEAAGSYRSNVVIWAVAA